MSEDFKDWLVDNYPFSSHETEHLMSIAWKGCESLTQAKLDAKAEELAALRTFAEKALECNGVSWKFENLLKGLAKGLKLIDADGQPTPLLTGEKE